jgi:hypothetical protein
MNSCKYVTLDVDSADIVAGVFDSKGNSMMECFVKTDSTAVRQFFKLLDGTVHVALEEGTQAGWLYDLIRPLESPQPQREALTSRRPFCETLYLSLCPLLHRSLIWSTVTDTHPRRET